MDQRALQTWLNTLILNWENEVVEFKGTHYSISELGKYFSALSNEANLRGAESAWLVLGVNNKSRAIEGTYYQPDKEKLQQLKQQLLDGIEPSITFRNIYEFSSEQGRVILFEIPPAPIGIPIAWQGHYYARAGESLTSLGLDKLDTIRRQAGLSDWTAQIVEKATIEHLDINAIKKAREAFAKKYVNRFEHNEVMNWSDSTFLDRIKITIEGKITRAALLLLGKSESIHFLSPHPVQLTWSLKGPERAYEHFSAPFFLSTTQLYQKIRNIQIRLFAPDDLIGIELAKYDQKIVLEALHNCIAHQDYSRNGRVVVTELPDKLILENEGSFFEGEPTDYIMGNKTPTRYRNPFLVQAMSELNMIDTMGYGIHEMYTGQARRYFPMPDYDLSDINTVKMTIYGGVVDLAYSHMLIEKPELSLEDIFNLDRVQKNLSISEEAIKHLRQTKLIEGRKPNFYISATVAVATGNKANYIHARAQDDDYYLKLILDSLQTFKSMTRKEIDELLWKKLSDGLTSNQKKNKIARLLALLRVEGKIHNIGAKKTPVWQLKGG